MHVTLSLAAMRTFSFPLQPWMPWAALTLALAFVIGLTVFLVVLARRSRWPERK